MRTNTWLVFLFFIFSVSLMAQEKITHQKRIYKAPDGKLYIQKDLPVYLRIATSPNENAPNHLLESVVSKQYTNPFYFDTEGYNTVRTPTAIDTVTKQVVYPMQDIIFEVFTDSKPPVSKVDFGKNTILRRDGKIFTRGGMDITIAATDEISGVDKIYVSIDGAPYKDYTAPLGLTQEKEYKIQYYAIDHVGNDEDIKSVNIVVDASKPVSQIEVRGDRHENVISGRSSIVIKSEDNNGIKKTYYSLNNSPVREYTTPILARNLPEGEHNLSFYAVDIVDNQEESQVFSFYVDKTPPVIVQEILGNTIIANGQEYSSGRSKLKLTTFDNKAGVKEVYYSINGGEYLLYTEPFYLSAVSGRLNIKAYALDHVNNRSAENQDMGKNILPYIDLSGPVIKYSFTGPVFLTRDSIFINNQTRIILHATDAASGVNKITYSIDNGEIMDYSKPFSLEKEGMHKISFTAADNVDNTNSSDFRVFVDNTGPEIFTRFSTPPVKEGGEINVYPSYVVLFISATDMIVGYDKMTYKINEQPEKPYDGYIIGFARDKDYSIRIKAQDKLGNLSESTVTFKTDVF